ncbi:MAG: lysophospholipid acyltransferase family protein [Burkholderiales bacterium]|nr:lysophospholipid acyltransferase family protein [Burkholderiales bacterium]
MLQRILRLFSRLPLPWIHGLGKILGWAAYLLSPTYASRLRENLKQSGCRADEYEALLKASISEAGKTFLEIIPVWFNREMVKLVKCDDWGVVDMATATGKGVIFLTPHLGCFEASALYGAQILPLTALYKKPKFEWLESVMKAGRRHLSLAPADVSGVRKLLMALKRGEAVGLLPDQAPGAGEGEWADFFGRPAYTMTLVGRLQQSTGAAIIMAFAERLPKGLGYCLHLYALPDEPVTPESLNRAIERLVRTCPSQYMWSYNRYKAPAGAKPRNP